MKTINLTLKFLEPYRVIEWHEEKHRNSLRFLRGYSYARWHNIKEEQGRPYITGTLIRSAVIRAAEELLWLNNGEYEGVSCCSGEFQKSNAKIARNLDEKRLRRRQTLKWTEQAVCSKNDPCPLCMLLGRCDSADSDVTDEKKHDVKFFNFSVPNNDQVKLSLEDIAEQRIINRIDQQSGKAEDFFTIWEIEHECCGVFEGKIMLSKRAGDSGGLCSLLGDALVMVSQISGALVTLEANGDFGKVGHPEKPLSVQNAFRDRAEELRGYFEKEKKLVHLRIFSDVIRDLRRYDFDKLGELPRGHVDRMGKTADHYIWDTQTDKIKLRDWLPLRFKEIDEDYGLSWPAFCENLGQALYEKAKESAPEQFPSVRPVGAGQSMQESKVPEHDLKSEQGPRHEWLITGEWIAKTPFFFGHSTEKDDRDHTNLRLISAKDGRLRLPRSVVRGTLRRDLKLAFGTGCRAELGHDTPCPCPVCLLMRRITVRDCLSKYQKPPQIRHRIRLDHLSGTVAKGALFDMEVGPRGVTFPFELRLRSPNNNLPKALKLRSPNNNLPKALKTVLSWWQDGKAFLSGAAGTGKGRFCLQKDSLRCVRWDMKNEFSDYKESYGGRKHTPKKSSEDLPIFESAPDYPWELFEDVEFSVGSPFLTKDPIRSLIMPGGNDAVCYESVYVDENGKEKEEYLLKGESFRGVLRTAVGRRKNLLTKDHEDCDCLLCKLFGNEHEAGKVRVEDLQIQGETKEKLIDRVAIDRFTGGAKDKHKFDMVPLVGTCKNSLNFRGKIWASRELGQDERDALREGLNDIRKGRYPLGGLGNVGLGWVNYMNAETDSPHVWETPETPLLTETFESPAPEKDKIYWPHYFLPFGPKVERENTPPGHHSFDEKLYSGKLVCSLRTLTPLIIPDTGADDNPGNAEIHKEFDFFELNGERCIPGSEIKGMISSVFEAITNSCLRVFNEKKRLSWRMEADKDVLEDFNPGRVTKEGNGFMMEEMKEYRYPFYDSKKYPEGNPHFSEWGACLKLTDQGLGKIKAEGVPDSVIKKLSSLKNSGYGSEKKFFTELEEKLRKDEKLCKSVISKHVKQGAFKITPKALGEIKAKGISESIIGKLNSLNGEYRSKKELFSALEKKLREEEPKFRAIILKNTVSDDEVPYYAHPTPTDKSLLSLSDPNHKLAEISEYKIVKNGKNARAKDDFMFLATPSQNQSGYKPINLLKERGKDRFEGYLKVTGPNKVEKENTYTPGLPSVQELEEINKLELRHNRIKWSEETIPCPKDRKEDCKRVHFKTVICGKDDGDSCTRARLRPEYACSDPGKDNSDKGVTYRMNKRCERVFIENKEASVKLTAQSLFNLKKEKDFPAWIIKKLNRFKGQEYSKKKFLEMLDNIIGKLGRKRDKCELLILKYAEKSKRNLLIPSDAIRRFEILVEEYRHNAKQQKTPEAFQTILPNDTIKSGDLVYFREENNQAVEIIPVRISRTVDNEFLAQKLPDDLRPCVREVLDEEAEKQIQDEGVKEVFQHHPKGLCPACALFGTSFYKGRIAFGFAFPKNGEPKLLNDGKRITLPLLERPRPTWSMPRPTWSMPDKKHKVPGRKFYVHHQGWNKVLQDSKIKKTDQTPNNRSVQAVAKDQEFRFEIRFDNLRDWELGLLIYALQLESPQFAHKLGMAKAFGFGSTKIQVEAVHFFEKEPDQEAIIRETEKKLKAIWGEKIGQLDTLFRLLHYQASEEIIVRYPALRKEDDPDKKDGYMELAEDSFAPQDRQDKLGQPWSVHWT